MSKIKEYYHNLIEFEIRSQNSLDAHIDQEYTEFKQNVESGKITEKDCKNPEWLTLYKEIKNQQLESNHSDYLKHDEWRDLDPDLD